MRNPIQPVDNVRFLMHRNEDSRTYCSYTAIENLRQIGPKVMNRLAEDRYFLPTGIR
jgi:hypothetical protein